MNESCVFTLHRLHGAAGQAYQEKAELRVKDFVETYTKEKDQSIELAVMRSNCFTRDPARLSGTPDREARLTLALRACTVLVTATACRRSDTGTVCCRHGLLRATQSPSRNRTPAPGPKSQVAAPGRPVKAAAPARPVYGHRDCTGRLSP